MNKTQHVCCDLRSEHKLCTVTQLSVHSMATVLICVLITGSTLLNSEANDFYKSNCHESEHLNWQIRL